MTSQSGKPAGNTRSPNRLSIAAASSAGKYQKRGIRAMCGVYYFIFERTEDGKTLKFLTIVDENSAGLPYRCHTGVL